MPSRFCAEAASEHLDRFGQAQGEAFHIGIKLRTQMRAEIKRLDNRLGLMGGNMAENLRKKGFELVAMDLNKDAVYAVLDLGNAKEAASPKEPGPNIRVNAVCTGMIDTDVHNIHTKDEARRALEASAPVKRQGTSDDVAELVCFLATDASGFITDANFDIYGGGLFSQGGLRPMSDFPIVEADDGITRQVLADHPDLMMVSCQYEKPGAARSLHHHAQVQTTFVQSGRFRFFPGRAEHEVGPGDSLVIPSGLQHGCTCIEPGTMIDSFTPRRADFL